MILRHVSFLALIGAVSLLLSTPATQAAPIVSISGAFDVGPFGAASGSVMTFSGGDIGSTITSDVVPVFTIYSPAPLPGSYALSNTSVTLTSVVGASGTANITTPLTITESGTGFTAVFNVLSPGLLNLTGISSGTVDLGFALQLVSNGTSLDLGGLNELWSYNFSFNGLIVTPGTPGNFTVLGAPTGTSSASFTLIRADLLPGATVPEPASILAWGLVIGVGMLGRRRYKSLTA